nr:hypothetical protein [uncultured Olsenella sp.]
MADYLVQKFVVHEPADASPILPQHVALAGKDGAPLGKLGLLHKGTKVAELVDAHNALLRALASIGLADVGE